MQNQLVMTDIGCCTLWMVDAPAILEVSKNTLFEHMNQCGMTRVRRVFVFLVNRVEHQKLTQTATTWWPFGFVFGVQLGSLEKNYGVNRFVSQWFM